MRTDKVAYSIEVAHTYASTLETGGMLKDEQLRSIDVARRLVKGLEAEGLSYSICVLVDDYHEGKHKVQVNVDRLATELEKAGCSPDFIVLESQLTRLGDRLLERIPDKYLLRSDGRVTFEANHVSFPLGTVHASSFTGYLEADGPTVKTVLKSRLGTYSCPLLTACWYLLRLGVEGFGELEVPMRQLSRKPLVGDRLLTVLPAKYVGLESQALEILEHTSTKTISKRRKEIEYYFFSDR